MCLGIYLGCYFVLWATITIIISIYMVSQNSTSKQISDAIFPYQQMCLLCEHGIDADSLLSLIKSLKNKTFKLQSISIYCFSRIFYYYAYILYILFYIMGKKKKKYLLTLVQNGIFCH